MELHFTSSFLQLPLLYNQSKQAYCPLPTIVGYQQTELENSTGYNFIIPTFTDVAESTAVYNLQNITLVGGYGDGMSEMIIGYNSSAQLSGEDYYWSDPEDGGMTSVQGWVNDLMGDDDAIVTTCKLPLGTGLYLNLSSSDVVVQYAGQVYQDEVETIELESGYSMVGNATPVPIDLQDLKLVGGYGDGMSEMIIGYNSSAQLSGEDYYWSDPEDGGMTSVQGWVNDLMGDDDALVSGYTLQPGQGVYLNLSTPTGVKVVIPSPMK